MIHNSSSSALEEWVPVASHLFKYNAPWAWFCDRCWAQWRGSGPDPGKRGRGRPLAAASPAQSAASGHECDSHHWPSFKYVRLFSRKEPTVNYSNSHKKLSMVSVLKKKKKKQHYTFIFLWRTIMESFLHRLFTIFTRVNLEAPNSPQKSFPGVNYFKC